MTNAPGTTEPTLATELHGVSGVFHFARDPLRAFSEAAERYGDVLVFSQPRGSHLLFSHPDAIEAILQHKGGELRKDAFTRDLARVLGHGLLTAEGEPWKRRRKLMAAPFQPRELEVFGESMVACTDELVARFAEGELRDVHADGMHLALDIVVRTLFGARFERFDEVERALEVVSREYRLLWQTWRALLPRWVPLPSHARIERVHGELDAIVRDVIREKRARPGADLLSNLIALADERGRGLDDEELGDEAMTLFLAGHETTALALTYALRLLATHPEAYARLLAEVDEVLGARPPRPADGTALAYTSAVVRESLRLFPPVWAMAREATADVTILGVPVPAGTQLIVSQWVVQRDARWFREPAMFRPERWLGEECAHLPRFAYFPFGGGPRVCIGQHFALLELVLVLARLSQSVVFEPSGDKLVLSPVITLRPKGPVRLYVRRRAAPGSGRAAPTPGSAAAE